MATRIQSAYYFQPRSGSCAESPSNPLSRSLFHYFPEINVRIVSISSAMYFRLALIKRNKTVRFPTGYRRTKVAVVNRWRSERDIVPLVLSRESFNLDVYTVVCGKIMDDVPRRIPDRPVRLIDQLRAEIRARNLSYSTERTYIHWILWFIRFHGKRYPGDMGGSEVEAFLNHLSVKRQCSVNTQKTALNSLVFLYREYFKRELQLNYRSAKAVVRVAVVFTHEEATAVIGNLTGVYQLIAQLLYGSGFRINECLRLRVKDIDFGMNHIAVRDTKGYRDRVSILPELVRHKLKLQIDYVRSLHQVDLAEGAGEVYLPYALERKYPKAVLLVRINDLLENHSGNN